MGVIAETADRVAVMYAGRVIEIGRVQDVIAHPLHPYAQGLMGAIPTLTGDGHRLAQIPGSMPRLAAIPPGCPFNPRCPKAYEPCPTVRPELTAFDRHPVACHLYDPAYAPKDLAA
jgi:peptide/nickel transport system ATP-binding protein